MGSVTGRECLDFTLVDHVNADSVFYREVGGNWETQGGTIITLGKVNTFDVNETLAHRNTLTQFT